MFQLAQMNNFLLKTLPGLIVDQVFKGCAENCQFIQVETFVTKPAFKDTLNNVSCPILQKFCMRGLSPRLSRIVQSFDVPATAPHEKPAQSETHSAMIRLPLGGEPLPISPNGP